MSYDDAIEYLYARLPMFTRDGVSAFKKDLDNTLALCAALDNPQNKFKSVHIAGTNGKGSTSHMLAAVLQQAGYKTGLYTSPHLIDFRERIRIDGMMIPKDLVVDFVQTNQQLIEETKPSFFEATVALAFNFFAKEDVDIAIIETGLGGRLDSTNIIRPILSVITNIGYDHMNLLGDTLEEIAHEKAGIIKPAVPVVVSEYQENIAHVFREKAGDTDSELLFASKEWQIEKRVDNGLGFLDIEVRSEKNEYQLSLDLKGTYQLRNIAGVLSAVEELRAANFEISDGDVAYALNHVRELTGLRGRWETLSVAPLVICDTGHNEDGWKQVLANIAATPHDTLRIVIGVMQDKDLGKMLPLLPMEAIYYFCQVDMPRALPAHVLKEKAAAFSLSGESYPNVQQAVEAAKLGASPQDLIFIGGSTFIVGEALS